MDAPWTGDRCFSEQRLILSLPCTTSSSAVRCPQKPLALCQPHVRGALTPASGGGGSGAPSPASCLQGGVSGLAPARGRTGAGSHLPAHPAQGGGDNALFQGGWGQRLGKWGRQGSRPGRQVSPGRLNSLILGRCDLLPDLDSNPGPSQRPSLQTEPASLHPGPVLQCPEARGDQGTASPGSWLSPLLQPGPQPQDCPERLQNRSQLP